MSRPAVLEEALFSTALALPPDERDAYLHRACPDASMHARIKALIVALDRGEALFPAAPAPETLDVSGVEVESYQLLGVLGEGGWGTVYLAEQVGPIRRAVALKIIKLGMDTKAVIQRFAVERQALAMMDHPNIAKVFDAGATRAGRPYFAMELVRGVRVTEYCDLTRASVAERLALFLQICRAIHHAHRKGVVHRDIKPSNVMVTLVDGMPIVKVIDFGVAKAIEGRISESTLLTAFDHFIGTPAYVSPEQAEHGGASVTTRSDIYSLGVVLYELLCGCTPFAANDLSSSRLNQLRARIKSEEPLPPSKKLAALSADAIATVARCCSSTRTKLIAEVRGDLDWIVMHSLEKEPRRRYQTAYDLASDLERCLNLEPVVARPRRLAYSAHKFIRRHRALVVNAAGAAAILVIAALVTAALAVRAERANRLVQSVAGFLQSDLWVQDEFSDGADADVLLRTMLDSAAQKVSVRFSGEPLVEASLRGALGAGYASIGSNEESQVQFERALSIYEGQYGLSDPRTLESMSQTVVLLAKQGRFEEAERRGLLTLGYWASSQGDDHERYLTLGTTVALAQFQQRKFVESRDTLLRLLPTQMRVLGAEHQATLLSMMIIATASLEQGNLAEAEEFAHLVVKGYRQTVGPTHPRTGKAIGLLQRIYRRQWKCGSLGEDNAAPIEAPVDLAVESVVVSRPRLRFVALQADGRELSIRPDVPAPGDPWSIERLLEMAPGPMPAEETERR
jgi:eukaryotic-like serine/threonine-protein kinase